MTDDKEAFMYEVPGMKLIAQKKGMSCWYASAQKLISWKQRRRKQSIQGLVPPYLDAQCRALWAADNGITNPQIITMAKRLGLVAVPPMSPLPSLIEKWLRQYGPLWVNGKTHIVVLAGINGNKVKIFDPAPVNFGSIGWRSISNWYIGGGAYTVKPGDSLSKIARLNDTTWQRIYNDPSNAAFKVKRPNPNKIYPGDVINIPTSVSSRDTGASVQTVFLHVP
jgi:ABC-type bacteriocin/lantibiotic exporter with double-glycine peptidase domain